MQIRIDYDASDILDILRTAARKQAGVENRRHVVTVESRVHDSFVNDLPTDMKVTFFISDD
jgi:hypothetical protein